VQKSPLCKKKPTTDLTQIPRSLHALYRTQSTNTYYTLDTRDCRNTEKESNKKWVTQHALPDSGMGRPERGHKGGEGERGMKDTGKETPSCRQVVVWFYLVRWLTCGNYVPVRGRSDCWRAGFLDMKAVV